jgi:hypothetical protein
MAKYALVKSGVVENVALGDSTWASSVASSYDYVVDVTSTDPQPAPHWLYNGSTFSSASENTTLPIQVIRGASASGTCTVYSSDSSTAEVQTLVFTSAKDGMFHSLRAAGETEAFTFQLADYASSTAIKNALKAGIEALAAYSGITVSLSGTLTETSSAWSGTLTLTYSPNDNVPELEVRQGRADRLVVTAGDDGDYTLNGCAAFALGDSNASVQTKLRAVSGQSAVVVAGSTTAGSSSWPNPTTDLLSGLSFTYSGGGTSGNMTDGNTGTYTLISPGDYYSIDLGSTLAPQIKTLSCKAATNSGGGGSQLNAVFSATGSFSGEEVTVEWAFSPGGDAFPIFIPAGNYRYLRLACPGSAAVGARVYYCYGYDNGLLVGDYIQTNRTNNAPYVYDFGSGNSEVIRQYRCITGGNAPDNVELYGSNNGSAYTLIASNVIENAQGVYPAYQNSTAYRYYRIQGDTVNDWNVQTWALGLGDGAAYALANPSASDTLTVTEINSGGTLEYNEDYSIQFMFAVAYIDAEGNHSTNLQAYDTYYSIASGHYPRITAPSLPFGYVEYKYYVHDGAWKSLGTSSSNVFNFTDESLIGSAATPPSTNNTSYDPVSDTLSASSADLYVYHPIGATPPTVAATGTDATATTTSTAGASSAIVPDTSTEGGAIFSFEPTDSAATIQTAVRALGGIYSNLNVYGGMLGAGPYDGGFTFKYALASSAPVPEWSVSGTGYSADMTQVGGGEANQPTVVAGSLVCASAGEGLRIAGGSNAKVGSAVLVGGTVTVSNTSVTANSLIFLSRSTTGGTTGDLSYTKSAGTSFTINSSSGSDTSTVAYMIVEQI